MLTKPPHPAALLSLAVGLALALNGCNEDEPPEHDLTGLVFAPECDPPVTITFDSSETAIVNRNHCEGYSSDPWDYVLDGDLLTMAPMGRLDDPNAVKEVFRVSEDGGSLTYTGSTSFFACGNCGNGDEWLRQ
jgi:hypothetical protein